MNHRLPRICTAVTIPIVSLSLLCNVAVGADAPAVVKLSPQIRELPRQDYADQPCDKLGEIRPETEHEQQLLAKRKRECLQKYRHFLPDPGVR